MSGHNQKRMRQCARGFQLAWQIIPRRVLGHGHSNWKTAAGVLLLISVIKFAFGESSSMDKGKSLQQIRQIDLSDYTFVDGSASACTEPDWNSGGGRGLVLTLIHSARHHFEYRQRIRDTWGSVHEHSDWRFRTLFILGTDLADSSREEPGNHQERIQQEADEHGDLILADFHDSYRNMSIKHLMGYRWVEEHCPAARWMLKADDDMFINPYALIKLLDKQICMPSASVKFFCMEMRSKPQRGPAEKWAVSLEEFPDPEYPLYCLGAAYLTTPDVIRRLLSVHTTRSHFWIDDVFVTGVLRDHYNSLGFSPILIQNIKDVFDLQAGVTNRWSPSKVFYLIKEFDRVHFQSMSVYWYITQMNRRLEERLPRQRYSADFAR